MAAGNDLDFEEVTNVRSKTGKKIGSEYDSDDSERLHETLSDWVDIDVKESIAANKWKSTVRYTAPPQKKKAAKPDPEEYDDEYYEEEEDELHEVNEDGENVKPAVEAPTPELPPKTQAASKGDQRRPAASKHKPQEPPAEKQKRY